MNNIAKPLAVFVTFASLAFAAFAGSLAMGGRNWEVDARSSSFADDYTFEVQTGDVVNYVVKSRRTGEQVSSGKMLAEVIVNARQKQFQNAVQAKTAIEAEISQLQPLISTAKSEIEADLKAIDGRLARFAQDLSVVNTEIAEVSQESLAKVAEIQAVRKQAEERREEFYRLRNQLELLRDDLYAAKGQRSALQDEKVRMEESLRRMKRRNVQLLKTLGQPYDEEAPGIIGEQIAPAVNDAAEMENGAEMEMENDAAGESE